MFRKGIMIVFFMGLSFGSVEHMLKQSWNYFKGQKIDQSGRPLADIDKEDISMGSKGKYLTFSESVSYVLFRSVIINDRKSFDQVWLWALNHLMRKNLRRVFNWEESRWVDVDPTQKDYLFAWRYTPNIKHTQIGGVIYVPPSSMSDSGWRNGLDVAPDGDQLIAAALLMAHNRWGSQPGDKDYLRYSRLIVQDIWKKCVISKSTGMFETFETPNALNRWFTYFDSEGQLSKTLEKENNQSYLGLYGNNVRWFGVGKHLGSLDLSQTDGLTFKTKENTGVQIILEDQSNQKMMVQCRYDYTAAFQDITVLFPKSNYPEFDWKRVKTIMFQPDSNYFTMDDIRWNVNGSKLEQTYYLLSNDKGEPWINPSYYMPFLYKTFSKLDQKNNWNHLFSSSLRILKDSKFAALSNQKGQTFQGSGILFPDWCMLDDQNGLVDLPWAEDEKIDPYMFSWDAFRALYFLSLTYFMSSDSCVKDVMKTNSYEFFCSRLKQDQKLLGGYAIDGRSMCIRGVQYEYPSSYGVYLAYFTALGDKENSNLIFSKLESMYHKKGYWGTDPDDCFKQNWAWLGLNIYANRGKDIMELLKVPAGINL